MEAGARVLRTVGLAPIAETSASVRRRCKTRMHETASARFLTRSAVVLEEPESVGADSARVFVASGTLPMTFTRIVTLGGESGHELIDRDRRVDVPSAEDDARTAELVDDLSPSQ